MDNIVLLNYVEISTRLRHTIAIPKVRGSKNMQTTRGYMIGQGDISMVENLADEDMAAIAVPQLPFATLLRTAFAFPFQAQSHY